MFFPRQHWLLESAAMLCFLHKCVACLVNFCTL